MRTQSTARRNITDMIVLKAALCIVLMQSHWAKRQPHITEGLHQEEEGSWLLQEAGSWLLQGLPKAFCCDL